MMDLNQAVKIVAYNRRQMELVKAEIEAAQAAVEKTPEWSELQAAKERRSWVEQALTETEAQLRDLAVEVYDSSDGDKHPHPAVTIKLFDVLVYDQDEAKGYCREHLPNALKLDTKTFEKAAKVLDLNFVQVVTDARATVATDLTPWFEGEG